ncbi:MAG: glycosyltransferase family 2 protein [Phototrophicaceae bacterium]
MISVVMPTFNAQTYLREAVDSVLAQTYPHFELLVIDDGSSDGTRAIVREYAARDARVRLIEQDRSGVSRACNTGVREARYPWIARLDADDIATPERFALQMAQAAAHPDVGVWGGYAIQINRWSERIGVVHLGPTDDAQYYQRISDMRHMDIVNTTCLLRRDIMLKAGGYDPLFDGAESVELLSRMARFAPMRVIPEYLVLYRIHAHSVTNANTAREWQVIDFIEARNRAWAAGGDLKWAEYDAYMRQLPFYTRLRHDLFTRSRKSYRVAGIHVAEKRYVAALLALLRAGLYNPRFTLSRVINRLHRQEIVAQVRKTDVMYSTRSTVKPL